MVSSRWGLDGDPRHAQLEPAPPQRLPQVPQETHMQSEREIDHGRKFLVVRLIFQVVSGGLYSNAKMELGTALKSNLEPTILFLMVDCIVTWRVEAGITMSVVTGQCVKRLFFYSLSPPVGARPLSCSIIRGSTRVGTSWFTFHLHLDLCLYKQRMTIITQHQAAISEALPTFSSPFYVNRWL